VVSELLKYDSMGTIIPETSEWGWPGLR